MALILNYIIPKIFLCPKKETEQEITGQVDTLKLKNFKKKLLIWFKEKPMDQILFKDFLSFTQLLEEQVVVLEVSFFKNLMKNSLKKSYQLILSFLIMMSLFSLIILS